MVEHIIVIVLNILLMVAFPYTAQINCGIDDSNFKLIKVKRFGFLFCGVYMESASKHGLIKSLYVIQIVGYILAFLSTILVFILLFAINVADNMKLTLITISSILGAEIIALFLTMIITQRESKKRTKDKSS